jgi:hypothetical protein
MVTRCIQCFDPDWHAWHINCIYAYNYAYNYMSIHHKLTS